jgi:hypothetical protein
MERSEPGGGESRERTSHPTPTPSASTLPLQGRVRKSLFHGFHARKFAISAKPSRWLFSG